MKTTIHREQPPQPSAPAAPASSRLSLRQQYGILAGAAAAIVTTIGMAGFMVASQFPGGISAKDSSSKSLADRQARQARTKNTKSSPSPTGIPAITGAVGAIAKLVTPKSSPGSASSATSTGDLSDPAKKDIAMQLVSSAENSSLNWRAQYGYIQDIGDGRGYTGGIIGFTSGTHDMLELVQYYAQIAPGNILSKYLPALQAVDGSSSHSGLDPSFISDWKTAANDAKFQQAQDYERDRVYFNPAVQQGKADGLGALGQFIYYDALVMHGPGSDAVSFGGIRAKAITKAKLPSQGGDQAAYLNAFLDARKAAMLTEAAHDDTSRVDTEQRLFVQAGNFTLATPLTWRTYGDSYTIK
jgi:chitosanase